MHGKAIFQQPDTDDITVEIGTTLFLKPGAKYRFAAVTEIVEFFFVSTYVGDVLEYQQYLSGHGYATARRKKSERFDPKLAVEIDPEQDWDKILSLPWKEDRQIKLIKSIKTSGMIFDTQEAEKSGFPNIRVAYASLNNVFRSSGSRFRCTHSFPGGDYWNKMKVLKFQ